MRVYLDNCCYNRPFDRQAQLVVRLETEAKLRIQSMMRSGEIEYAWSDILSQEALNSPFLHRREKIMEWRQGAWRSRTMRIEDTDLCVKGLSVLIASLGNVEAERFVCLMNQGAGDYTEWRRTHLFPGETVHSLAKKAQRAGDSLRRMDTVCT